MYSGIKWHLLLPNGHRMWELITHHSDHYFNNWWATFSVSATASLAALLLSLIISVLAIRFKTVDILVMPFVALSQSFPLQTIAPLLIVLLGMGFHTKAIIARSEERRVGKECTVTSVDLGGRRIIQAEDGIRDVRLCDWSSDVCSSDLGRMTFRRVPNPCA